MAPITRGQARSANVAADESMSDNKADELGSDNTTDESLSDNIPVSSLAIRTRSPQNSTASAPIHPSESASAGGHKAVLNPIQLPQPPTGSKKTIVLGNTISHQIPSISDVGSEASYQAAESMIEPTQKGVREQMLESRKIRISSKEVVSHDAFKYFETVGPPTYGNSQGTSLALQSDTWSYAYHGLVIFD